MDKMNLLIVDDEIKTLRLLQVNLEKSYKIFVAENGAVALKILESEPIDIILTDLKMPQIDGETLFKYVKENKFWPSVGRINNAYGDRNLVCSCLPISEYETREVNG